MFLNIDKKKPDKTALIDNEGNRLTYEELTGEIRKAAGWVESRSVIFILCSNTVGAVVGYLGFIEAGAVPLVLNRSIDEQLLKDLTETYTPAYLWMPEEAANRYSYEEVYRAYGYVLMYTGNEKYPLHEELQFLMATSGSTGSPKLVRYKRGNLEANAKNVAIAFGWTEAERPVCDLGMQYTMGLNVINTHLYVGATVLLTTYNLLSSDFWDYVKIEKATNFTGVPFSYDILHRLRFERMNLPYLKTIASGGGKLTDERFRQLAEYAKENGKRFISSFGTTETSARMACLPPELAMEKTGSIGRAIPEGELFLVDPEGHVLSEAEAEGELCYRGPNVTMGYALCREDLSRPDDFKGVYHTGDLARRDADGCYYVTGRLSRFLKILSYRISLDRCEQLIQQEFGIECACAGTDARMNIYLTDGSYQNKIQEFIVEKTGLYKSNFKVITVPRILRNDSGKIRYREMDERYSKSGDQI